MCLSRLIRFGFHVLHSGGQHQFDAVELVNFAGAGVVVDSDDVRLGMRGAQSLDDALTLIAPIIKVEGWELYAITFTTPAGDTVSTELRFTAGKAPMAVMKAEELSTYDGWENDPDLYEEYRPYRANIVFSDGWLWAPAYRMRRAPGANIHRV